MVINVSEALCTDTAETITVTRVSEGGFIDGLYVKGTNSTFKTLASVQQPTPKQLEILPEGERNKDNRVFISKKPIRTSDDALNLQADTIRHKGTDYKIVFSADWDSYGYTMAIGTRNP